MGRTRQDQLAQLAKREAALKRAKAKLRQADRRAQERKCRDLGALVMEAGLAEWPREKLAAALSELAARSDA